ncbi:hypothetical protein PHISP_04829 [Aspergillus sp. HF37]|nr:hypothetical protein PHISP_04829 [Aspergillus sp. HF37]
MGSPRIAEILRPNPARLEKTVATISGVKHLTSYNWLESRIPTIAVPGIPPRWNPPPRSKRVAKDKGLIFISQNAARYPQSPLEPLFRALLLAKPAFDFRDVGVVTDRNNIRKLLTFVNPKLSRNPIKPFAINVEVCDNTALFGRTEEAAQQFVRPDKFVGYGHNLEKAFTASELSGSTGHHRIISYGFNGLNLIVRHETDAYWDTRQTQRMLPSSTSGTDPQKHNSPEMEDPEPRPAAPDSELLVKEAGSEVPLALTLELKSRHVYRPIEIDEVLPQLWISQTPNLARAHHQDGRFRVPPVMNITGHRAKWEKAHQDDLRALGELIKRIIGVVKDSGGSAVVEYDGLDDKLVVSRGDGRRMLPEDLYSRMAEGGGSPSAGN